MKHNQVAVIMSVYRNDVPSYFKDAVESILNQTMPVDLLICCDGPLTEELVALVDCYSKKYNVIVINNTENKGLAYSLNQLIELALKRGHTYIARMDSDDISHLNRIQEQFNFLENNRSIDVLGSACSEFGASFCLPLKELPSHHKDLVIFSVHRCPFIHPTVMFRANVFKRGSRYPVDTAYTEDLALWYELILQGFTFANLSQVLLDYRLNESTLNRRTGFKKACSEFSVRFSYMMNSGSFSFKSLFFILLRTFLAIAPVGLKKLSYKYVR